MIRAFDSDSGETLWEHRLPSGGFATPCTYEAGGKQFVVIAAGGGKDGSPAHDEFIAFSL
jgi:quinoprotein glucose dehydrogenase